MTRLHTKNEKVYINGVDLSGHSSALGALDWNFETQVEQAFSDECKNGLTGRCDIQAGSLSAFLDNDTAGLFALASAGNGTRNLMAAFGVNGTPAAGDPIFAWAFEQTSYNSAEGSGFVAVTIPFAGASYSSTLTYSKPWGVLLHPKNSETGVNASAGIDDAGASSSKGGIFVYHLFSSDGTVTLKMQDAATNSDVSFADVTDAASGWISGVTPTSGMVSLGTTATIRKYLRWQMILGTATSATFVCAFIRN